MILKNCRILNGGELITADIEVSNGKIQKISQTSLEGDDVIDVKNNLVIPGAIDAHVHFRDPGQEYKEDFYTGSCAAAAGGVTTVLDMPNNKVPITTNKALEEKRKSARKSIVNYGFHFGATSDNIEDIRNAENIAGVKVYMGSTTGTLLVDKVQDIRRVFDASEKRMIVHAEDEERMNSIAEQYKGQEDPFIHTKIRDNVCAEKALKIAIKTSKERNAKLHVAHASTKEEILLIKEAKYSKDNASVTCEVCPHHLFLTNDFLSKKKNFAKMNPPLRSREDRDCLWTAIRDGVVDIIATDHAPHTVEEKQKGYWQAPSGVPGVQTMLPLLLNEVSHNRLSLIKLVELCCENPALIFGIKNKGFIKEGYDADLAVIDMGLTRKIRNEEQLSKCGWTVFDERECTGWPVMVFVRGKLVYDLHRGITGEKGDGIEVGYA